MTTMWATDAEKLEQFYATTFAAADFRIYNEWDNGEFLTGATVDLIERGMVVHTQEFVASSEDAPGDAFSAYGNGRDNHASTQARSYAWSWVESQSSSLEERLAPFGLEWQLEQEEGDR